MKKLFRASIHFLKSLFLSFDVLLEKIMEELRAGTGLNQAIGFAVPVSSKKGKRQTLAGLYETSQFRSY